MAQELKEAGNFKLGAVDCVRNENLCTDLGIEGKESGTRNYFPVLRLVWGEAIVPYPNDPRSDSSEVISSWVSTILTEDSDL